MRSGLFFVIAGKRQSRPSQVHCISYETLASYHYDERLMSEKKVRAISFLGDKTSREICEDEVQVVSDDDDGFVEVLPSNGELVALIVHTEHLRRPSSSLLRRPQNSFPCRLPGSQTLQIQA